ncbi:MAG: hypothetical protein WBB23_14500 [Desulforhopalus sp.]
MPEKEILYYINHESNTDELYLIAVACIERLTKLDKPGSIKAIVDSGTTSLYKMTQKP